MTTEEKKNNEKTDEVKKIIDYELGSEFNGHLIIKEANVGKARNGTSFLSLTVADKSGEINGKIWDVKKDEDKNYPVGKVVEISGYIEEYNSEAQMKFATVNVISADRPEADPALYIRTAPISEETMMDAIKSKIDTMIYPDVKTVVRDILNRSSKYLFTHAAATKNHHAYQGGLGFHIVSMLNIAEGLVDFYPQVDHSLLYAGIILHDIGKIQELTTVQTGSSYTTKGKLLGHISMIETEIVVAAARNDINPDTENIVLLRHMVLSHHGKLEWGSAVKPQTREAHALHYIDMLDARMNMTHEALAGVEKGDFSPRIYPLENAPVYNPTDERTELLKD